MILAAVLQLIGFQGPDGRVIHINPEHIVTIFEASPDASKRHFSERVHCLITLSNGKFVTVIEDCNHVRQRLKEMGDGR